MRCLNLREKYIYNNEQLTNNLKKNLINKKIEKHMLFSTLCLTNIDNELFKLFFLAECTPTSSVLKR